MIDTSRWNEARRLLARISGEEIEIIKGVGVLISGEMKHKKRPSFAVFVQCDPNGTDVFNVCIGTMTQKTALAIEKIYTIRGDLLIEYVFPIVSLPEDDFDEDEDEFDEE